MRNYFLFTIFFINSFAANADQQRIVAVGGSITEIIFELGMQGNLVGVDSTSYYPESATKLPQIGYQRALSVEGILSLNPSLIIMTNEAGPQLVVNQIKQLKNVKIISLKAPRNVVGVIENIKTIGKELNKENAAKSLISRIEVAQKNLDQIIKQQKTKPRIMFILNHGGHSPMIAGLDTAANSIIKISGAENVANNYQGYKPLTPESAINLSPEIILIGEDGLKQFGGIEKLMNDPSLKSTPAILNKKIIAMDSMLMLGFGPRVIEAATKINKGFNNDKK